MAAETNQCSVVRSEHLQGKDEHPLIDAFKLDYLTESLTSLRSGYRIQSSTKCSIFVLSLILSFHFLVEGVFCNTEVYILDETNCIFSICKIMSFRINIQSYLHFKFINSFVFT